MKSTLLALAGAAALLSSISAFAGPDFTVIERARAEAQQRHHQQAQATQSACVIAPTEAATTVNPAKAS